MKEQDQPGLGWTVVLRRQPARIVAGRAEGGYTDAYELVCCECGDHPDLDYRQVSPRLRRIRGPYPFAASIAAYERHVSRYHRTQPGTCQAAPRDRSAGSPPGSPGTGDRGLVSETVTRQRLGSCAMAVATEDMAAEHGGQGRA